MNAVLRMRETIVTSKLVLLKVLLKLYGFDKQAWIQNLRRVQDRAEGRYKIALIELLSELERDFNG